MGEPTQPDTKQIARHWKTLCSDIGQRVAGSRNEHLALQYIADEFEGLGLARCHIEPFEFANCAFADCDGSATVRGKHTKLKVRPIEYATSTPKQGAEGEMVFLESAARADYGGPELKGKIGLFLGCPLPEPRYLECLMQSGLAAAMFVDNRYRVEWPMSLGFPEMWADRIRMPLFSIPFTQAWDLVRATGPVRVKLRLKARRMRSKSGNAIADLPGTEPKLRKEIIYVSGHVDSVRGSVGANDDASGSILAMEAARLLRGTPLKRTVRFAGYGVEERLSVGSSRHYQNRRKNGMTRAVFGYNADSCSAAMGVNRLTVNGPAALVRLVKKTAADAQFSANVVQDICPYSDQFALNMLDVPTVWTYRPTLTSGNWFFHSQHDRLDAVSVDVMARQVGYACELVRRIGNADKLPFKKELPAKQRRQVEEAVGQFHGLRLKLGRA